MKRVSLAGMRNHAALRRWMGEEGIRPSSPFSFRVWADCNKDRWGTKFEYSLSTILYPDGRRVQWIELNGRGLFTQFAFTPNGWKELLGWLKKHARPRPEEFVTGRVVPFIEKALTSLDGSGLVKVVEGEVTKLLPTLGPWWIWFLLWAGFKAEDIPLSAGHGPDSAAELYRGGRLAGFIAWAKEGSRK